MKGDKVNNEQNENNSFNHQMTQNNLTNQQIRENSHNISEINSYPQKLYNNEQINNQVGYTQLNQTSQNTSGNSSFLKNNKKNLFICFGIIIGLLLLLTLFIKRGASGNNGYTASKGDILKVNEITDKFNVKITSPLEKSVIADNILFEGDCLKLGISINNTYKDKLDLSIVNLSLIDENKKRLFLSNIFYDAPDNIGKMSVGSGETKNGYLYFTDSSYNDEKSINTLDLKTIKYLEVSVLNNASKDSNGTYHYSYEDYYLEL